MQLDLNDIVGSQKYTGQKIWICDYRKELDKKAIRNVKPTEVFVAGHKEFEAEGLEPKIYYSQVGFAKLNKKGEPLLKQLIPPFDTTGHRWYTGVGVMAFDNENECIDAYNNQVLEVIAKYELYIQNVVGNLAVELQSIRDLTVAKKD